MILRSLVHQLGEIALPMEVECVDDLQVLKTSAIVPSTPPAVNYIIPEFVDRLLDISLDIQTPSTLLVLLISLMLKELVSHMAVHDHIYGHWLQISEKVEVAVHVKTVQVPHLLWEIITIVNQDIMALMTVLQS